MKNPILCLMILGPAVHLGFVSPSLQPAQKAEQSVHMEHWIDRRTIDLNELPTGLEVGFQENPGQASEAWHFKPESSTAGQEVIVLSDSEENNFRADSSKVRASAYGLDKGLPSKNKSSMNDPPSIDDYHQNEASKFQSALKIQRPGLFQKNHRFLNNLARYRLHHRGGLNRRVSRLFYRGEPPRTTPQDFERELSALGLGPKDWFQPRRQSPDESSSAGSNAPILVGESSQNVPVQHFENKQIIDHENHQNYQLGKSPRSPARIDKLERDPDDDEHELFPRFPSA
ncbi:hypothetical protein PGT21_006261 [Puccinia graminis f. sp. tritici]|uniref:Uncharacterized protein n=1 Tax=Puccinia graminis f. sp. tritici TaxID=56615 RepID=A0A5B0MX49_PUCGR|nr:hypothetical protein PGT21_006261 [Puccinia graminis f. sp. tritici]